MDFQDRYVLVPAYKTGKNVIIICKKHYMEVNCKKLIPKQGNPQECSLSSSDIVEKHLDYMRAQWIQIPSNMHHLLFTGCLS